MRLVEMREEVRFLRERLQVRDDEIAEIRRDHARAEQEWRILLQTAQRQLPAAVPDAPHAPVQSEHDPVHTRVRMQEKGLTKLVRGCTL